MVIGLKRVYDDQVEKKRRDTATTATGGVNYPSISRDPKAFVGEQVTAGWSSWLSEVAGEAINGWLPRRAETFEKLDKIGQGTYSHVYRARDILGGKIVALEKVRLIQILKVSNLWQGIFFILSRLVAQNEWC